MRITWYVIRTYESQYKNNFYASGIWLELVLGKIAFSTFAKHKSLIYMNFKAVSPNNVVC